MKNTVDEIIKSFTKEELREFKYFLNRRNDGKESRIDIALLDQIRKGTITNDNVILHRQAKNRMKKHLELFVAIDDIKQRTTSQIFNKIEVASFLFRKGLFDHAWDYLSKAETIAKEQEEYELLNYIYYIELSYSYNIAVTPSTKKIAIEKLIEKWSQNNRLAVLDNNTNAAYAELFLTISSGFTQRLNANVDEIINPIMKKYDLGEEVYLGNMKIFLKTVNIVCRLLREKREYTELKEYSLKSFYVLRDKRMLNKVAIEPLIDLLDVICISALRTKDYVNYEKFQRLYTAYIKKMDQTSSAFSYYDFIPSIDAADLYMCTNRLPQAKRKLLDLYSKYKDYTESPRIFFLLRVNLIAAHFKSNEFDKCLSLYAQIIQFGEKKILEEPGFRLELMLFTDIYAVMFHYQSGDNDYALYLSEKLKRKYKQELSESSNYREAFFLKLLESLIRKPECIANNKFKNEVTNFLKLKEFIPGDNEYISFNAWLISKISKRTYYSCFLEIVSP
jgi:hypothetical protein